MSMKRAGIRLDSRILRLQYDLTNHVVSICHLPSSGLWEQRDQKKHYTYSKAMAWLALSHGVESTWGKKG
jgi:GH15 family glucan-1,4-alpha-glucosidase